MNGNQDTLKLLRSKILEGTNLVCFVPRVNPGAPPPPRLPVLVLLGASMPLKCKSQLVYCYWVRSVSQVAQW